MQQDAIDCANVALEKFNIDVLGRVYPAPPEVRRGLA